MAKQRFCIGEDCIAKLLDTLHDWVLCCCNEKQAFGLLRISQQQQMRMVNFCTVLRCICGKDVEKAARVIRRCQSSGGLVGVAHSKMKLRSRTTIFLPVFSHNLSRFGAHPILKQLKLKPSKKLSAIGKTDKNFLPSVSICLWVYTQKFLESCKTLSIDALPRYSPVCFPKFGKLCVNTQSGQFLITYSRTFFQKFWTNCSVI